jgi:TIR domain
MDSIQAQKLSEESSPRSVGLAERRQRSLSAFIFYAHESDSEFRDSLIEELRTRGIETKGDWLLTPGSSYKDQLAAKIRESDVFIAVIEGLPLITPFMTGQKGTL